MPLKGIVAQRCMLSYVWILALGSSAVRLYALLSVFAFVRRVFLYAVFKFQFIGYSLNNVLHLVNNFLDYDI